MTSTITNIQDERNAKRNGYLIIAGISLLYFIYMLFYCDIRSLWMDDLAQIQIAVQDSLVNMFKETIILDNNPPLYHFLSYFWIRLVPYGTGWLKLLNIIFVSIGLYLCGITAMEIKNRTAGIICVLMGLLHRGVVFLAAYTFRPYGLFFLLSAMMLFFYVKSRKRFTVRGNLLFLLSMILAVYTHYFAILLCIGFFLFDVYLVVKKRFKWMQLHSYPLAAVLLLPWIAVIMKNSLDRLKNFWPKKPNFSSLCHMVYELLGEDKILVLIVLLSAVTVLCFVFYQVRKKSVENKDLYLYLSLLVIPAFSILSVYGVSKYADSFTSLFVTRYFVGILPFLLVLCGLAFSILFNWFIKKTDRKLLQKNVAVFFLIGVVILCIRNAKKTDIHEHMYNEPFQEVSEYLMTQEDIYDDDVVIFNTCNELPKGWDYYLSHKGARDSVNVIWYSVTKQELKNINKVYVAILHLPYLDESKQTLLNSGYQLVETNEQVPVLIYEKRGTDK